MLKIYHNNRCSKSRQACTLLTEKGLDFETIEYLKTPPTVKELTEIVKMFGIKPIELVRKNEDIYKSTFKDKKLTDADWIKAMVEHPVLIERPIVVNGNKAVVGRPLEKVLEIL